MLSSLLEGGMHMFEKIVRNIDELNAVALHLSTTENFDALKSLAKEWQISKQDTEAFISGKRYRLADVTIEDRDYSRPEEKLRIEMFALKDKYFADIIGRYVIKKCIDDAFGKNVLLKHKSLQKCLDHIMEKAFHIAEEQAKQNGQEHIQQNAALALPETQVFHWAEEYFLLRYTGLREMLKEIPCISPKHYFESLKEMPYLEQIIKAGLIQFAYELMENPKKLQLEIKKDLGKFLGIDRFRMNRLREHKGGILYLEWLGNEKKLEKKIPDPVIQWFVAYQISPDEFSFISDRMSETQIKNYLERQKTYTDHTVKNLLTLWKDYLTMAKRVGLNINDAIVYRTRNLEKRHDEMVQLVKDKNLALKAGNIAEAFPKVDAICRELKEKYEYESKGYRIVEPKGIEDILKEGCILHHCVDKSDNYFERINTRESYILFLRKSENPDTPYYTLEVERNRQAKAYGV